MRTGAGELRSAMGTLTVAGSLVLRKLVNCTNISQIKVGFHPRVMRL